MDQQHIMKVVGGIKDDTPTPPKDQFWKIKYNAQRTKYVLLPEPIGFTEYLSGLGVCFEAKGNKLVRHKDGIVKAVEVFDIKKMVQDDINSFPEVMEDGIGKDEILSMVMTHEAKLFKKDGVLEFLPRVDFNWLRATRDSAFYPYKNGVVKVIKDKITVMPYEELEGKFIWDSKIIDRDFNLTEPSNSDWADFVYKASGATEDLNGHFNNALGYVLHGYKDPTNAFLTVFGESVEDSNLGGGAGKGLTCTAISKIVPTAFKDMKQYSTSDAFSWSSVSTDTAVFILSDLKKNFKHSALYNMVTDGFEVNKKNKPVEVFDFEDSPKIIATTNFSLNTESNHGNRRLRLVEFGDHWNAQNTPVQYYGKMFFHEWSEEEWKFFDSYMMLAVAKYLREGFPQIDESETSRRKRILEAYGAADLLEWLSNYSSGDSYVAFNEIYLNYQRSAYVTDGTITKHSFLKRLEDVMTISNKEMDIRKNGNSKFLRIWSTE